jgi:C4-type Zn-finger protein
MQGSTDMPTTACPYCDRKLDMATDPYGRDVPHAGDVSVCRYCYKVAVFTKELNLRKPTQEEDQEFLTDPRITELQLVMAWNPVPRKKKTK